MTTMTFLKMRSIQNSIVRGLTKLVNKGEGIESLEQYKAETMLIWDDEKTIKDWLIELDVSEYLNK